MIGQQTLVTAARVRTGFPGSVLAPGAVLVEGDSIRAVGRPADFAAGLPTIDLGSRTVIPGLIDAHVHLGFDGTFQAIDHFTEATDTALLDTMRSSAAAALRSGVTTVRELGARGMLDVAIRDGVEANRFLGPLLLLAMRPMTSPRGHCWFMGGECASHDDVVRMVDEHAQHGARWLKVMVSGGILTANSDPTGLQFDQAALDAAVRVAHGRGLRVAAHAHSTASIRAAVTAGCDTVEHCSFMGSDGSTDDDPSLYEVMARQRVAVCPTVNCQTPSFEGGFCHGHLARIAAMRAAGVRIIAGTDAGVPGVPHGTLAAGLEVLSGSGMTNGELMACATSETADVLGMTGTIGVLRVSASADLVALPADPVMDLRAVREVSWVMRAGRVLIDDVPSAPTGALP